MKGLLANVYRDASGVDCTNGGVSSRVTTVTITGSGIPGIFDPKESAPELRLRMRVVGGEEYCYLVPAELDDGKHWVMFGGNYAHSSDSRIRAINKYPLPIHDRVEPWEK